MYCAAAYFDDGSGCFAVVAKTSTMHLEFVERDVELQNFNKN